MNLAFFIKGEPLGDFLFFVLLFAIILSWVLGWILLIPLSLFPNENLMKKLGGFLGWIQKYSFLALLILVGLRLSASVLGWASWDILSSFYEE